MLFITLPITNNVLVLIPPPVEPGEAPINIKMTNTNNPAFVKFPKLYVENPAVLAETLWKKAPNHVTFSVSLINNVPITISAILTDITALEWNVNFLKDFLFLTSIITKKPIPPKIINPLVTKFNKISFW